MKFRCNIRGTLQVGNAPPEHIDTAGVFEDIPSAVHFHLAEVQRAIDWWGFCDASIAVSLFSHFLCEPERKKDDAVTPIYTDGSVDRCQATSGRGKRKHK